MKTATIETLFEETVKGLNTYGEEMTTVVAVETNPEWNPETSEDEYRYHVISLEDDAEQGREDFDDLKAAKSYARELVRDARAAIKAAEKSLREEHAETLAEEAGRWHKGEDRELAEAVASILSDGDAAKALAALKAAGLI